MDSRLRGVFVSILTGIATVIAAILLSGLPILNMLVLVFPIPFIVIGVKRDILHGYLSLAAAIALLSLMAGPVAGVFLLALTLLPIGGIVYALKKRLDLFESSVLSCISVLASIFLFIQVYS
ncbi:MAG TPA: DUF2232 domain-containing protein, partial [Bacillota bacterium]|nr:DUF2232 domain-containing protein [Bacillota bacterium]